MVRASQEGVDIYYCRTGEKERAVAQEMVVDADVWAEVVFGKSGPRESTKNAKICIRYRADPLQSSTSKISGTFYNAHFYIFAVA
jgi:hypothetical protein